MGFLNKMTIGAKKVARAMNYNPSKNNNLNPQQNFMYTTNPRKDPSKNPNVIEFEDTDNDNVPDMVEQDGATNRPAQMRPPSGVFGSLRKENAHISKFDHKGQYKPVMTYPLPPVSYDNNMFNKNKQKRNADNVFLQKK